MDVEIRVSGIPCLARVTHYRHARPNYSSWDSPEDYHGGWVIYWSVCDRRGRRAEWLERKLTDDDRERIEGELIEHLAETEA